MTGIVIALVEVLLPFMVLALDAALLNIDRHLYEAARNLGAGADPRSSQDHAAARRCPGIVSGSRPGVHAGDQRLRHAEPDRRTAHPVMATLIYQQSMGLLNWPFGAAIAFVMLFTISCCASLSVSA